MPIYAYKCESCGYTKDVLQKMSDAPLSVCPPCGATSFKKQLTAAGFQLKGSGWYVTDFRGGAAATAPAGSGESGSDNKDSKSADAPAAVAATVAPKTEVKAAAPVQSSSASADSSTKGAS